MEQLPNFSYELVKQGNGNPVHFALGDITEETRSALHKYSLEKAAKLRYWTFSIEEWFVSDPGLNDFSTYNLCLVIPASHVFVGHVQNVDSTFKGSIVLASSGVSRANATGIPFIGNRYANDSLNYIFTQNKDLSDTYLTDDIVLIVKDHIGNDISSTAHIKYKITYKEHMLF